MPGSLLSVEALRLTKFPPTVPPDAPTLMEASSANSGGLQAIRKSTDAIRPYRSKPPQSAFMAVLRQQPITVKHERIISGTVPSIAL